MFLLKGINTMPKFLKLIGTQFAAMFRHWRDNNHLRAMFRQWREDKRRFKQLKEVRRAQGSQKIAPYWD